MAAPHQLIFIKCYQHIFARGYNIIDMCQTVSTSVSVMLGGSLCQPGQRKGKVILQDAVRTGIACFLQPA